MASDTFTTLLDDFYRLTQYASRFRRVALHIHSPESHDFGSKDNCDPKLNNKQTYLAPGGESEYINHLRMLGHFDLVAITDHMKLGYACRLAQASTPLQDIQVLPGIELNLRLAPPLNSLRLHVLAIFPQDKDLNAIERIFPSDFPVDEKRTGNEEIQVSNLPEFIKKIRDHEGICIAAHVDNNNGVRLLFRQTGKETLLMFNDSGTITPDENKLISDSFKSYLVDAQFDGLEVRGADDRNHYSWETQPSCGTGSKHHVPVFLTFDAHTVEMLARQDRITYVKMTEVSWLGLKRALQFPQTRIRFSNDRVPPPHILGIEILSPSRKGFFPSLRIGFVENMNCIIGPRGSGKSTIVEAFRYAFGYNRTLDELESPDLKNAIIERQRRNLRESIVRVAYRLGDTIHFLEATYDEHSDYTTKVYDEAGNLLPIDNIEQGGKYPFRLFGWSEIETLGREPDRQRDLLDKLIPELANKRTKRSQLRDELKHNSSDIKGILERLDKIFKRNDGEIRRYKEYLQEFEKLNTPDVQKLFTTLDELKEHAGFVKKLKITADAYLKTLNGNPKLDLDKYLIDELAQNPGLQAWWQTTLESDFARVKSTLNDRIGEIAKLLGTWVNALQELILSIDKAIDTTEGQIRATITADPKTQVLANLRDSAKQRLDHVETLRDEYKQQYDQLTRLLKEREALIGDLLICHTDIGEMRSSKKAEIETKLNEFQTPDMKITLELVRDGDREEFETYLQGASQLLSNVHRQYKAKKLPELIATICTPIKFANCILANDAKSLISKVSINGKDYEFIEADSATLIKAALPFAHDEMADVDTVANDKLATLLDIQEIEWDDTERILRNGHPVDKSSPGQRSSAMLPLIALAESVPLLIDQPEDNLDNRLVGHVLVDILAKLKEKRQIIIMTHNPNIVVLGDAEQVIVLDALSDTEGRAESPQASIDHPFIVGRVIELMEGGKEAFDTRQKRYTQI
jgi:DNA repair exonuclease SbcCD ATPase subunit